MATEADIHNLTEKMREERDALLALCVGLDNTHAEVRPPDKQGEEGWSTKEQLAHLAEMESRYREWAKRAVTEDAPDLTEGTVPDPVAVPLERAHDASVGELLEELRLQRATTEAFIASLDASDYDRTASQRNFGELTVLQWLRSYYRHDRMHRAQIQGREPDYQPRFLDGEPDQRRR